ncbi:MAG: glucose-6-phosphate isomerase [Verrucomicrobiales bacterium]|nr:glucose-6-phosphate isomerase [Verrucomicrobiales bacterium]
MTKDPLELWERFKRRRSNHPEIGLALDLSRLNFADDYFESMAKPMQKAFVDMRELEEGAISNPDENRMVGHYWLRNSQLAPDKEIQKSIDECLEDIKAFAESVHAGEIQGEGGEFENMLLIGIGGSALGPQFVSHALGNFTKDRLKLYCFDNTDPDGNNIVFSKIGDRLSKTIVIVISKSGGTKETRNGMLEAKHAYNAAGLDFGKHSVAVTGEGSQLDKVAIDEGWLKRFPMWDWVGGRTSETAVVGLLPAALQGIEIDGILEGASKCDSLTRTEDLGANPAALLAVGWHHATHGRGEKDMVILPYKDRLELLSRYLQQLIMESLGKEKDLEGNVVNQGIAVYGNKGSTDQHAYIQQLREGAPNFFVTFIEVLRDRSGEEVYVENPWITSGDYLSGFFQGTRKALFENGRESMTITVDEVTPFHVGVLIALYERAVGLYASLIGVNAYHQPGVEAGKKAAETVIGIQKQVIDCLMRRGGHAMTVDDLAMETQNVEEIETIFKICEHLSANGRLVKEDGSGPYDAEYALPSASDEMIPGMA